MANIRPAQLLSLDDLEKFDPDALISLYQQACGTE
jgi:hypothetical protein